MNDHNQHVLQPSHRPCSRYSDAMTESFELETRRTIAGCFPDLTEDELSAAVEAFLGYIDIVNDVYDLLDESEPNVIPAELTASDSQATVEEGQVEPINQKQSSPNV